MRKMETFLWSSLSSWACMFIFSIICLSSMVHTSEAQATIDPKEVKALNTIFTKWKISDKWNISTEPCSGIGRNKFITCGCSYNNGTLCHITDILLTGMNINGTILEELQNLPQLTNLFLSDNSLTGPLPSFIGNLTILQGLYLNQNSLYGIIPKELGNLPNLKELHLSDNSFNGIIPNELGNLQNLDRLDLSSNALSGTIPNELGNLTNLVTLLLSINFFIGPLPSSIGNLSKMQNLGLGHISLNGTIPKELGNLQNLLALCIDSAGLSGEIPSTFANLTKMIYLKASDNNFIGRLPDFIGTWTNMKILILQGNAFQGPIPSSFSRLSLEDLQLGELSNASSSLEFTKSMTSLKTLILRNCMITDSLQSYIVDFPKLEHLDLSFNNISGTIPQYLFNLGSLKYLFLGDNNLTGALPSNKGSNLTVIDLSYNSFSGSLPSWARNNDTNLQLNLVANNFNEDDFNGSSKHTLLHCLQKDFPCNRDSPQFSSFAVNSGGPAIKTKENIEFEDDDRELGAASFYITNNIRWAVSSTGIYLDRRNSDNIINSSSVICNIIDANISLASQCLLKDVRVSAGSLRYYGLGLHNGNYTINIRSVQLDSPFARTGNNLQRHVFDIYIQGELKEKDFEIKKGGNSFYDSKEFKNIPVTKNYLEIHLFGAGKGLGDLYGPSIAAVNAILESALLSHLEPAPKHRRYLGAIIGIPVSFVLILLVIFVALILKRNMFLNQDKELRETTFRTHTFSYAELKRATDGFSLENKLGEGGFGPVYKGVLSDGRVVAVKQLSLKSRQGMIHFVTEIDMISAVQHRNLVKLYGCCIKGQNKLLVYEYLENKSLDQVLFGKNDLDLSWKTRIDICVGTGRGLAYLHEESQPRIVHRDVKASNILLDANMKPKLSDFGLAKLYDDSITHISTRVAGTFGYLAPEYAMKGQLSEKTDVFGFGVVLLEILSGRSNFSSNLSPEQVYLLEWAWLLHENSRHLELIDPRLKAFNKEEAIRVFNLGLLCTQSSPILRPSMSRVVSMLLGDVELIAISSKPGYLNDVNTVGTEDFPSALPSTTFTSLSSGE